MSTARSNRTRTRIDILILFVAALGACGLAQAKQSDKNQPININASAFAGSQDSGKITFTGWIREHSMQMAAKPSAIPIPMTPANGSVWC
jgi:lipopolysaccharide export system protein LptA